MDKQQMIEKIYEVIADKTLSFGCNILYHNRNWLDFFQIITDDKFLVDNHKITTVDYCIECEEELLKTIWHPVMIWDVLDWMDWNFNINWLIELRKEKRKPIEDQSTECIEFVYNLLDK